MNYVEFHPQIAISPPPPLPSPFPISIERKRLNLNFSENKQNQTPSQLAFKFPNRALPGLPEGSSCFLATSRAVRVGATHPAQAPSDRSSLPQGLGMYLPPELSAPMSLPPPQGDPHQPVSCLHCEPASPMGSTTPSLSARPCSTGCLLVYLSDLWKDLGLPLHFVHLFAAAAETQMCYFPLLITAE